MRRRRTETDRDTPFGRRLSYTRIEPAQRRTHYLFRYPVKFHPPVARALVENYGTLLDEIVRVKPAAAKGRYLRTIVISSTMGPGIKLDTTRIRNLLEDPA